MKVKKINTTKLKLTMTKHSPKIFVVSGVVGMTVSAVLACKSTLKASDILKEEKEVLSKIDKEDKKERRVVKAKTGVKVVKTYIPAVAVGTVSVGAIFYGHGILSKRNAALGAAYTALDQSFKEYRKKVIETIGEEAEHNMRFGVEEVETETEVEGKNGKKKVVKETKRVYNNPYGYSPYARIFDENNRYHDASPDINHWFLVSKQRDFNDKLAIDKVVFLNDVYRALGFPPTKAGQLVGWIYDPGNPLVDSYIDFGLHEMTHPDTNDFVNGYKNSVVLDFNVDGEIIDLIDCIDDETTKFDMKRRMK